MKEQKRQPYQLTRVGLAVRAALYAPKPAQATEVKQNDKKLQSKAV